MFWGAAHGSGSRCIGARFLWRDSPLDPGAEPPLAAHLITPRALYCHHGIYIGRGRVIHYAGLAYGLQYGPVEDVSLERFARGRSIRVRHEFLRFDRREVVERARSRLGERRYRILTNNCEHFCAWAMRDESRSSQVEWLHAPARAIYGVSGTQYQRIKRRSRAIVRAFRRWSGSSGLKRAARDWATTPGYSWSTEGPTPENSIASTPRGMPGAWPSMRTRAIARWCHPDGG